MLLKLTQKRHPLSGSDEEVVEDGEGLSDDDYTEGVSIEDDSTEDVTTAVDTLEDASIVVDAMGRNKCIN